MAEELEKTCENCEYENEDMEGTHCRHCIHNAEENFAPKINHEKEIRDKVIDEFAGMLEFSLMNNYRHLLKIDTDAFEWITTDVVLTHISKVKEQLKGGADSIG